VVKGADFEWLRGIAGDEESREWVSRIEEWHRLALGEGKYLEDTDLFWLSLGNYRIWLRKCNAFSSMDIYTEIFKGGEHFRVPGFSGEDVDLVIDLGANEGFYTLKVKENNPHCRVIAVEPNPLAFEVLEKNVTSNGLTDVILVNKAVCDREGTMPFQIVPHVSAIGARDLSLQQRPWLKQEMIRVVDVECMTLRHLFDEYGVDRVGVMKLDVEGMELDILKGGETVLPRIERIVVECHSQEIRDGLKRLLGQNGFDLVFEEQSKCGDLYFARHPLEAR